VTTPGDRTARRPRVLTTFLIAVAYLAVMAATNTRFTLLDDECRIVGIAGRPIESTLGLYFSGNGLQEQHPPLSNVLLHLWLVATHYSFFALRIFANLFYIAGILLIADCAFKIKGRQAYLTTLALGLLWPFAFQYGRITGWYSLSFFLVSWVTWGYLTLLEDRGSLHWPEFAAASVLLVWTNYFGALILLLLFADFWKFHRKLAAERWRSVVATVVVVMLASLPLVKIALQDMASNAAMNVDQSWRGKIVEAVFPVFAIFGSVAVAPWFFPLSLPVAIATLVLLPLIWFSVGRRWLIYFSLTISSLELSHALMIKRVLFLLPWLFLAMGLAAFGSPPLNARMTRGALIVLLVCGWTGILWGKHYAISNLYEPWDRISRSVAQDARMGATIVSFNAPFFLYLDYQLGIGSETKDSDGPYLGESTYRSHGYSILYPDQSQPNAGSIRGKVVLVEGTGWIDDVQAQATLDATLRARCRIIGEYRAAPDPAAEWKQRYFRRVPVLAYRSDVVWLDCP